jgi:two-component system nitrate/nitrite response regulator NarL
MRNKMTAAAADQVRIVVLGEHELFREGLCLLLSRQSGFKVVGDAGTLPEGLSLVQREQPDIVLFAIEGGDGIRIDLLPELLTVSEQTRILVLLKPNDPELQRKAIRLGAVGVLSKDKPARVLVKAIECVNAGEAWVDRFTTASLLRELSPINRTANHNPEEKKIASLSEREREVIQLVGKGLKNKQIADTLFISDITVHHHLTSIYSKLDVADRLELLIFSYRNGLAELPR